MSTLHEFESFRPPLFDMDQIQEWAEKDPIDFLTRCNKRAKALDKGTRKLRWELLVSSYAGALGISKDPEKFDELLKHEFFEGRSYKCKIEDVLRLAILIGTDTGPRGTGYKSTLRDVSILQPHFDQRVEPSVLMKKIKAAHGLNRLNENDDKAKVAVQKAQSKGDSVTGSDKDESSDDDLDKMEVLEVHLARRYLLPLLDSSIGTLAKLSIKHTASHNARKRIEGYDLVFRE